MFFKNSLQQAFNMDSDYQELNRRDGDVPALRFRRVKIEKIYFEDFIITEFKNSRFPLPENLKKARNNAIIIGILEFICCFLSFGFYDLRRSRAILAFIIIALVATAGGFYAKLKLHYCGILTHGMFIIPVIGGFYIYILIDYFFGTDSKTDDNRLSGTSLLFISSIPLLLLFFMGMYSIYLVVLIDEELESRKKQNQRVGIAIEEPPPRNNNRNQNNNDQVREARQRNIGQYAADPERAHQNNRPAESNHLQSS